MKYGLKYDKLPFKYLEKLEKRVEAVMQAIPRDAAVEYYQDILRVLPAGAYADSLTPFRSDDAYGVALVEQASKQKGTLIYVNPPKKPTAPINKIVTVLQRYSPWTPSTFPEIPPAIKSLITYKQVPIEAENTRNKILLQGKYQWSKELFTVGLKLPKVTRTKEKNLISEGISKEFGYGEKALPHWAPALRKLARTYGVILRKRKNKDMLSNPSNQSWKKPPAWKYRDLAYDEVLQYKAFMTQLARKL